MEVIISYPLLAPEEELSKISNVLYFFVFYKTTSFCGFKVLAVLDVKKSLRLFVWEKKLILKINNMLKRGGKGQNVCRVY